MNSAKYIRFAVIFAILVLSLPVYGGRGWSDSEVFSIRTTAAGVRGYAESPAFSLNLVAHFKGYADSEVFALNLVKAFSEHGESEVFSFDWFEPPTPDLDADGKVTFEDFGILASAWTKTNADAGWQKKIDLANPRDNRVDSKDLLIMAEHWLEAEE